MEKQNYATPQWISVGDGWFEYGLTKRELFAGMAMQALLSATDSEGQWTGIDTRAAKHAVIEADDLIAALEDTNNEP